MYIPASFRESDEDALLRFMTEHAFATLVTHRVDEVLVSHLPLLVRRTNRGAVLVGHVARANTHWRAMDGKTTTLAIFHGPHEYVSPTWYRSPGLVPTWNYAAVYATGEPRFREDEDFTMGVLRDLVDTYESGRPQPWSLDELPADSVQKMSKAIVAFEMPILRLEGKFKLSQNQRDEDRDAVIAALDSENSPSARAVAALMRTMKERARTE